MKKFSYAFDKKISKKILSTFGYPALNGKCKKGKDECTSNIINATLIKIIIKLETKKVRWRRKSSSTLPAGY